MYDITSRIEKDTYIIRTQIIATLSDIDLKTTGVFMHTSDDDYVQDKPNHNESIVVGKTILDMAYIHANGYSIYLINPEDMSIIYEVLDEYINNSNTRSNYSPNVNYNITNDETLILLDNLAQDMFEINKKDVLLEEKEENSFIGFDNAGFINKMNFNRPVDDAEYIRQRYEPGKAVNVTELLK